MHLCLTMINDPQITSTKHLFLLVVFCFIKSKKKMKTKIKSNIYLEEDVFFFF